MRRLEKNGGWPTPCQILSAAGIADTNPSAVGRNSSYDPSEMNELEYEHALPQVTSADIRRIAAMVLRHRRRNKSARGVR